MKQNLDTYLKSHEQALVRFLQQLLAIPTENPPGADYAKCTDFLVASLRQIGLTARRYRVPETECRRTLGENRGFPRYNVVGRWKTGAAETLHFNGHYDVVPAGDGWRFGPFNPKVEKGWIYGRGTSDMKGSLAALWFAVGALKACGIKPACNVEVSFTADEESDSRLGVGHILKERIVRPHYAVVCEGGGRGTLCYGHNGKLWYDVVVYGKSAHAARPENGVNAFEKMAQLVEDLQKYKRLIRRRSFTNLNGEKMYPSLTMGGRFDGSPEGKVNSIPGRASFTLDRRLVPSEKVEPARLELEDWITRAARKIEPARIELIRHPAYEPCFVDPRHRLPETFIAAASAVRRSPVGKKTSFGFNDMHFFAERGIPVIGYGAQGENDHGVDERIRIREIMTTARTYARFLAEWPGA